MMQVIASRNKNLLTVLALWTDQNPKVTEGSPLVFYEIHLAFVCLLVFSYLALC